MLSVKTKLTHKPCSSLYGRLGVHPWYRCLAINPELAAVGTQPVLLQVLATWLMAPPLRRQPLG